MRSIELLSPARNLECGIEAIRHGADAVYIGAPRFGARAAAGNSIEDIEELVRYAHPFGVRIYVTVNTLLYDDELPVAQGLIDDLAAINVDALIVQDPRIRPTTIPLHSSTQMDNRTVEDVRARLEAGYTQTVLARELSLDEIRAIHTAVPEMPLEAFVHGALCVCYSGRCYASEYCFNRSANRGECAQFCRLPFQLINKDNGQVVKPKSDSPEYSHYLSLRDMNRAADLEAMMDAGISSLKIEGRLKDVAYVKNITAYYRQLIDAIIARRPQDFRRSSFGTSTIAFTPDPERSFNRGFTDYFLHTPSKTPPSSSPLPTGDESGVGLANLKTPKSIGVPVAIVRQQQANRLQVAAITTATLVNGDGLCYFDAESHLRGFRVNRIDGHNWIYPAEPLPHIPAGTTLYRNYDQQFEQLLSRPTAERKVTVRWLLTEAAGATPTPYCGGAFSLTATDEAGHTAERTFRIDAEPARTPQCDAICRQLMRLGDTPYACTPDDIEIRLAGNPFIPASVLAEWRREVVSELIGKSLVLSPSLLGRVGAGLSPLHTGEGAGVELSVGLGSSPLMTCRYCLRHELGACLRTPTANTLPRNLALRLADGRIFPLRFDCNRCEMQVFSDHSLPLPGEGRMGRARE